LGRGPVVELGHREPPGGVVSDEHMRCWAATQGRRGTDGDPARDSAR
jgi:hypothetical protein